MLKRTGSTLIVFAALAVAACQPPAEPTAESAEPAVPTLAAATEEPTEMPTEAPDAEGDAPSGNWTLVSMGSGADPVPVPDGLEVTANFVDGTVSGTNGCNNYNAPYTVDGESLTIAQGVSTMMACDEPAMTLETDYMAALQSVTGFAMTDGNLVLMYGDGNELVFAPALAGGLDGSSWEVTSYNNGQEAVVSLVPGSAITLMFADGRVNGRACNDYMGDFTVDGDSITVGTLASTKMMCVEEGVMEQEQMYLAALQAAATWSVNGSTLTLRDASDAMQVVASAAPSIE
jgi:heat shock protein HslJ